MGIYFVYTAHGAEWEDADGRAVVATPDGEWVATLPEDFDPEGARYAEDVARVVTRSTHFFVDPMYVARRGDYWEFITVPCFR